MSCVNSGIFKLCNKNVDIQFRAHEARFRNTFIRYADCQKVGKSIYSTKNWEE